MPTLSVKPAKAAMLTSVAATYAPAQISVVSQAAAYIHGRKYRSVRSARAPQAVDAGRRFFVFLELQPRRQV